MLDYETWNQDPQAAACHIYNDFLCFLINKEKYKTSELSIFWSSNDTEAKEWANMKGHETEKEKQWDRNKEYLMRKMSRRKKSYLSKTTLLK